MKRRTMLVLSIVFAFSFLLSTSAFAHFLWMDPIGFQTAAVGEEVNVSVYLHAEEDDNLHGWSLSLGFDESELTFVEVIYGDTDMMHHPFNPNAYYEAGVSLKYPGESVIRRICKWSLLGFTPHQALSEGEDFLLFTATFVFNGGFYGDGEDLWIEHHAEEGWDFDEAGGLFLLPVYTDNTMTTLFGDGGADFGSAQVPVPASIYLLSSGFLAFLGIRRKAKQS